MSTTVSTLGTLRQRLRQDTDDIHQMLHQNAAMLRLMSDDCSFSEYMDVLRVFFVFYVRGEYLYRSVPDEQRFIHEVQPLEWLQKDFALAGIAPPSPGLHGVSPENSVELASALESYIGYLYVKQGSTLGGKLLVNGCKNPLHSRVVNHNFSFMDLVFEPKICGRSFCNISHVLKSLLMWMQCY